MLGIKYDYVINDFIEFLVDKDKYGEWRRNIIRYMYMVLCIVLINIIYKFLWLD